MFFCMLKKTLIHHVWNRAPARFGSPTNDKRRSWLQHSDPPKPTRREFQYAEDDLSGKPSEAGIWLVGWLVVYRKSMKITFFHG